MLLFISVDDASGHYTAGLFYGNNYWIGSLSLCKSIYREKVSNSPVIGICREVSFEWLTDLCFFKNAYVILLFSIPVRTRQAKDEISFNDAYNPAAATLPHENPPFLPGFFVLKVKINETEVAKYVRKILQHLWFTNAN